MAQGAKICRKRMPCFLCGDTLIRAASFLASLQPEAA